MREWRERDFLNNNFVKQDNTLLHYAIEHFNVEAITTLIAYNFDIFALNKVLFWWCSWIIINLFIWSGKTPLDKCLVKEVNENKSRELLRVLSEHMKDINKKDGVLKSFLLLLSINYYTYALSDSHILSSPLLFSPLISSNLLFPPLLSLMLLFSFIGFTKAHVIQACLVYLQSSCQQVESWLEFSKWFAWCFNFEWWAMFEWGRQAIHCLFGRPKGIHNYYSLDLFINVWKVVWSTQEQHNYLGKRENNGVWSNNQ